jgi:UDP-N-acetylglucosamine:LPS N-acetylglucosamine transferase
MVRLAPWWKKYDRFWVTFSGEDTATLLSRERVYHGYFPDSRNIINAIRHTVLAWHILMKEKPTIIISCGAGIAPPFLLVGKLLGIRTVFIEPFDLFAHPSLAGRIVYPFVDIFLVQHQLQKQFFPSAQYHGSTL